MWLVWLPLMMKEFNSSCLFYKNKGKKYCEFVFVNIWLFIHTILKLFSYEYLLNTLWIILKINHTSHSTFRVKNPAYICRAIRYHLILIVHKAVQIVRNPECSVHKHFFLAGKAGGSLIYVLYLWLQNKARKIHKQQIQKDLGQLFFNLIVLLVKYKYPLTIKEEFSKDFKINIPCC